MTRAQSGNTVKVHYTGKLDDGSVFDSSAEREPLEFTLGQGQVIAGFEQAIEGMAPGETKSTTIAPEDAYGPRREEMMAVVSREHLPKDLDVQVGQQLALQPQGGERMVVKITEVSEATVTLDANHELAGQRLTFDLELVDVK